MTLGDVSDGDLKTRLGAVLLGASAVVGALFLLAALAVVALDLRILTVRSGSMEPAIGTGALAVARTVPAGDLAVGDVVSVPTGAGGRVTHRVVTMERNPDGTVALELRGDANRVADADRYQVAEADRVWLTVPGLGYAAAFLASPLCLLLLGAHTLLLLRILLAGRASPSPRHRVAARRMGPPRAALAISLGLVAILPGLALGARSAPTLAAWTDPVTPVEAGFSATTIPAPSFSCGLIGAFSVRFNWSAVPGATSYTLHYGSGGSQTRTTTSTSETVTTLISGGTAWVTAHRDYGSTTWTSANSTIRHYTVAFISLCG